MITNICKVNVNERVFTNTKANNKAGTQVPTIKLNIDINDPPNIRGITVATAAGINNAVTAFLKPFDNTNNTTMAPLINWGAGKNKVAVNAKIALYGRASNHKVIACTRSPPNSL